MKINTVGIIGAGVMGAGVAQNFAQSGIQVILLDLSENILDEASQAIYQNVRMNALFNKNKESQNPDQVLERIEFTTDYARLKEAELVVENVIEEWQAKKEVHQKLDQICSQDCLIAVNTSCISITQVASITSKPDKIVGIHFMNPVPLKDTVEVIRGFHTAQETIDKIDQILKSIGKNSVVVNDFPGFVSNRISHLFMNEAMFVVQDQVATAAQVDEIFKKCYGHTMGPLETADLIGLDTVMNSLDILYQSYQDSKFRCCPLLKKMVAAGLLGRKSGKGFYDY